MRRNLKEEHGGQLRRLAALKQEAPGPPGTGNMKHLFRNGISLNAPQLDHEEDQESKAPMSCFKVSPFPSGKADERDALRDTIHPGEGDLSR